MIRFHTIQILNVEISHVQLNQHQEILFDFTFHRNALLIGLKNMVHSEIYISQKSVDKFKLRHKLNSQLSKAFVGRRAWV